MVASAHQRDVVLLYADNQRFVSGENLQLTSRDESLENVRVHVIQYKSQLGASVLITNLAIGSVLGIACVILFLGGLNEFWQKLIQSSGFGDLIIPIGGVIFSFVIGFASFYVFRLALRFYQLVFHPNGIDNLYQEMLRQRNIRLGKVTRLKSGDKIEIYYQFSFKNQLIERTFTTSSKVTLAVGNSVLVLHHPMASVLL